MSKLSKVSLLRNASAKAVAPRFAIRFLGWAVSTAGADWSDVASFWNLAELVGPPTKVYPNNI